MSQIPGGFGTGFKVGYTGTNTITGTILAYKSAKYEKQSLRYQAEIADLQANSYHTAADDAKRAGQQQAAAIGYQAGQAKSSAKVSQAASGVRVGGSGSSAEVLASIDISKEMQVNQVIANSVAQSWGYRRTAVDYENKALSYEVAAKGVSPWAAAISSLATSMASIASPSGGDSSSKSKDSGAMANWQDFMAFGKGISSSFGGMGG